MSRDTIQDAQIETPKFDLYFSVDVETLGLIPVRNSLISLGAAVIRDDEIIDTFSRNVTEQPGTIWGGAEEAMDPGMLTIREFWLKFPEAYKATQVRPIDVTAAFMEFGTWVRSHVRSSEYPIFLAYPATFDFTFCSVLCNLHCPEYWPFGFAAFDMQSYAAAILNVSFSQARSKNWPKQWRSHTRTHTHIAVDDAIEQAKTFIEMRKWLRDRSVSNSTISTGRGSVAVGGSFSGFINTGNNNVPR